MKKIISIAIIALVIFGYFSFIYNLNNRQNIIKREPKSIFEFDAEALRKAITLYPTLPPENIYTSPTSDLLPISIGYPDNWTVEELRDDKDLILTMKPLDAKRKECIKIYQIKESMPLLEAINYSKYMLQTKNTPYSLSEPVETTIHGIPTHISKLHLSKQKSDKIVRNAVLVKDNTFILVVRSCEGTSEEIFFATLNTLKI